MRPNYAMDAPPTFIEVGGFRYTCETDYRVWIEVQERMRKLRPSEPGSLEALDEIEQMVFGGVLADERPEDVLNGIIEFLKGYPMEPNNGGGSAEKLFSYEYDLNSIVIAIRNQSGIDISYRRTEPFHWWEFLLEFHTLCGEHYILNLMSARGYKGKDREMLRRKYALALPEELTREEQDELEAFNAQFATGWEEEDE
ncbi:MAG: hypothetical protein E7317_04815 [Clostridiales bacterium]|nr:hypothetical protein [Clostridiales bacterium]